MIMRILFVILSVLLCLPTQAQQAHRISGDFTGYTFGQFVYEVERNTPLRFYYSSPGPDSLSLSLTVTDEPLETVLQQIFKGTEFRFAIDSFQHVFITRHTRIRTQLPPDFFTNRNYTSDTGFATALTPVQASASAAQKLLEIGSKSNAG